jgi:hypothetical protein
VLGVNEFHGGSRRVIRPPETSPQQAATKLVTEPTSQNPAPTSGPPSAKPAVLDRGRTLSEQFRAALPQFPEFVALARRTYCWVQGSMSAGTDEQVVAFAWEGAIYSERPEDQARRAAVRGSLGPFGLIDAGKVERFVERILAWIGGEVRAKRLCMTGMRPGTGDRYEPDAACLDEVRGEDRVRNRVRDNNGVFVTDVRFHEAAAAERRPAPDEFLITVARRGDSPVPAPNPPMKAPPKAPRALTPLQGKRDAYLRTHYLKPDRRAAAAYWKQFARDVCAGCVVAEGTRGFSPRQLQRQVKKLKL